MSQPITLASLQYIRPQDLASYITTSPSTTTVIDVRDSDYIGGHIKNSIHVPQHQLDARLPELLRMLRDKDRVVFHCMLSQQRGPSAALRYARAKAAKEGGQAEVEKVDDEEEDENEVVVKKIGGQEICVLQGGFQMWQSRYGNDKGLTEGYVKELWESVFA